ncbi:MAG: hypothetical protein LH606_13520 [Cytophagaceae bacterium]|nr:hypothetical protein [Cytophagaceae bacterium]
MRAGFFVKENLALGLGLSQQWRSSNNAGFSIRPFVRYYKPLGERFNGFLQGEVFYRTNSGGFIREPRFGLNAGLGLVYFAHKRLSIEATTNLVTLVANRIDNIYNRGYNFNAGANLNANALGLSIAFYTGANPSARTPDAENSLVRGTRLLGGSFGFNGIGSFETSRSTALSLNPQIGWFVRDNVALGLSLGVGFSNTKSISDPNSPYLQQTWSASLQPFVRNYAMLGPKVGVFLESGLAVGFRITRIPVASVGGSPFTFESRTFFLQAGVRPGITYFLGRRFAVEATTGFVGLGLNTASTLASPPSRGDLKSSSLSFSPTWLVGSGVNVGLKYYIQ